MADRLRSVTTTGCDMMTRNNFFTLVLWRVQGAIGWKLLKCSWLLQSLLRKAQTTHRPRDDTQRSFTKRFA